MKYIPEDRVLEILNSNIKWKETIKSIGVAMETVSKGQAIQNPRSFTKVDKNNGVLLTMPGYLPYHSQGALACKLVTAYPNNEKSLHLPNINAYIALFNEENGTLKAVIAGTEITKWRTAAASAVATRYITPSTKPLNTLAILGCGAQGRAHAEAFHDYFDFKEIRLWNRTPEKATKLASDLNARFRQTLFKTYETVEECVKNADVIVTATFASEPFLKLNWVKKGAHINALGVGVNHYSELEEQIYLNSDVYVDHLPSAKIELAGLETLGVRFKGEIGSIIAGNLSPNADREKITVFQSLGMAVQDCVMAKLVFDCFETMGK